MKELHLGVMKNKELAEWFGIKPASLRSNRGTKLKELGLYAEFEDIPGGVNIKKILGELSYNKQGSKAKQIIKDVFDEEWSPNGIDTCRNVSSKIYTKYKNELAIMESTTYNYTRLARNELYGKPFMDAGLLGQCKYLWCKQEQLEDGTIVLTEFTAEEQEIKQRLMKKYFATNEEKDILIREMVEAGEISKEEAYDLTCEYRGLNQAGFMGFKMELEQMIGCPITKGTIIERKGEQIHFLAETIDKK